MTQEEIKEGNRIIAEFMELRLIHADDFNKLGEASYTGANKGVKWGIIEYLKYNSDWSWLMPVVEKIELELGYSLFIFFDEDGFQVQVWKELCSYRKKETDIIVSTQSRSKIDSVFQAVVQFINWYNTNGKQVDKGI